MGRDQRLRRAGVIRRRPQPPQDPDYWKKRALHFERALLAAVASCPDRQLEVPNQDLTGMVLDAEELVSENGERRGVRFKVQDINTKKVHVDEVKQPDGELLLGATYRPGTVHFIPKAQDPGVSVAAGGQVQGGGTEEGGDSVMRIVTADLLPHRDTDKHLTIAVTAVDDNDARQQVDVWVDFDDVDQETALHVAQEIATKLGGA